ncbi:basic form of pathogenesis-related protein 1-like [Chenopodium quinoa]|uniref:SCP domain-containing protein n=1 Tax=Chenopodium quinoa TaxID=63459 RepID=A0A803LA04_CHEQI|nr:basic form of pathogenesis-related protein 1-like [Chenopodium quinoa]
MRLLLFSIALLYTITFLLKSYSCQNQDDDNKTFLNGHNAARREVGVDPYTWDKRLEAYAQDYANKAKSDCNTDKGSKGPYGLNLASGYEALSSWQAMDGWANQKSDYNYTSNSCAKGKDCTAYTQVVWRKSIRLGCGGVACGAGWPLYVCVYDPAGNIPGQKPY